MATVSYSIQTLFSEITVNSTTGGSQSGADIALLGDGDLVVAWQSDESSTLTFQDVRGQRFNADGTPDGAEFVVQAAAGDYENNPNVAALSTDGEFVVVYEDTVQNDFTINTGGSGGGVDVNLHTSSGGAISGFPFNPLAETDNQTAPAVAVNSAGQMAVVLLDPVVGSTSDNRLKLHLFNEGETEPFVSTNFVYSPGTTNILSPSVTALNNDTFVATWVQDDDPGAGTDMNVYHLRFNASQVLGSAVLVNDEPDLQASPVVTSLADGGYVIVWMDTFNGSATDTEIEFHIYNADGTSRNYGSVYSPSGVRVDEISVSAISDGAFVVTFTEETASENQVRARVIGNDGTRWGDVFTIEDQGGIVASANQSSVAGLGSGNFATVWRDFYAGNSADTSGSHIAMQGNTVVRQTIAATGETVTGDDLIDQMFGSSGNESLYGGANNDRLEGFGGHDMLFGEQGDDLLIGGDGADILNGGNGADEMVGGSGNDTYIVDRQTDTVTELLDEGTDLVRTAASHTLGDNVENGELLGSASINLVGNGLNNVLTGNSAANILLGGSGNDNLNGRGGADDMRGGIGDDDYVIDSTADTVTENAGAGTDLIRSVVSYTLSDNVENGIMLGSADLFLAGNALDNTLVGNAGNNTLNGRGGADRMFGNGGDDTYVVDDAGDLVGEVAGNGNDTVLTVVSRGILEANVERLTMIGTDNINGSGNEDSNVIRGNSGNNTINGRGGSDTILAGLGMDTQYGGAGSDTFVFNSTAESGPSSLQRDRIADFTDGDRIFLATIDADETVAGDQAFVLDTGGAFSAGEIRQTQFGSNLLLEMNIDADAAAEMSILLLNSGLLDAGDFVF